MKIPKELTPSAFNILPYPFNQMLVFDPELFAFVDEAGQHNFLGVAVDNGSCIPL